MLLTKFSKNKYSVIPELFELYPELLKNVINLEAIYLLEYKKRLSIDLKGIVSRDWGDLQMILLQRLEVFIISATSLFLFSSSFSYRIFKNGRLSSASF